MSRQSLLSYLLEVQGVRLHGLELPLGLLGPVDGLVSGQTQLVQLSHLLFHQGLERRHADSNATVRRSPHNDGVCQCVTTTTEFVKKRLTSEGALRTKLYFFTTKFPYITELFEF